MSKKLTIVLVMLLSMASFSCKKDGVTTTRPDTFTGRWVSPNYLSSRSGAMVSVVFNSNKTVVLTNYYVDGDVTGYNSRYESKYRILSSNELEFYDTVPYVIQDSGLFYTTEDKLQPLPMIPGSRRYTYKFNQNKSKLTLIIQCGPTELCVGPQEYTKQ